MAYKGTLSQPATTKVASERNYLDSLALAEGLHKPVVDNHLVRRYGRQDITGLIETLGRTHQIQDVEFHHYEKDRIHGTFRASASASAITAGTSASSQIVVASGASGYDYTYDANYASVSGAGTPDSFSTYIPQKYDIIEYKGYQMLVTTVAGRSANCYPVDSSASKPALGTDTDIIVLTNAHPEGSSSPESRNSQLLSYTNYLQIFRRNHRVTGTEEEVQTWVEVEGPDGEKGYFWHLEGLTDEHQRFMNEREAAMIAAVQLNNPEGLTEAGSASYGDTNSLLTTEGVIPQISGNGLLTTYTTLALSDVEGMTIDLQKYRGDKKNMLGVGHDLRLDFDALFRDAGDTLGLKGGGLIFNQFNGAGEQSIKFEFDKFSYGGFSFALQTLDIFSDPTFMGYAEGPYSTIGMVLPMGNTVKYNRMNQASGEKVPSMRINHLGKRSYKETVIGWDVTGNDYWDTEFLSHCGVEMFALNRFGLFAK